ncbi:MAG: HAD-IA family hydrolase [Gammaproteobacteria bacterium]|jgi:putative hydrolase of the HAD superfamily|nr:HAD-IA family hydrolase [Gammaproteobacteria bacterium]
MIKALTFDLDDTLWAVNPVIERANQRLLAWLEHHAPAFAERYGLAGFNQLRDEVLAQKPSLGHDMTRLRLALLELGLQRCGYSGSKAKTIAEAGFAEYFAARNEVNFYPHAISQLQKLKPNYMLGALTNGNADLHLVGLGQLFDFGLNAAQVGVPKPAPDMFVQALKHMQLQPQAVIHIGDHPEADIMGAQNMGMHTIWVNLQQQIWPASQTPASAEINDLGHLADTIKRIHKDVNQ